MKKISLFIFGLLCLGIGTGKAQYNILLNFDSLNGANPQGALVPALAGNTVYGMTNAGGIHGVGTLFSMNINGSNYNEIASFGDSNNHQVNGGFPIGDVTPAGNKLYGMTDWGGKYGEGTIFSIDTNGSGYKDLFDFVDTTGTEPYGDLVLANGKLYGMTNEGGKSLLGNVFSIDTDGSNFKNLVDFTGTNGARPFGSLILIGSKLFGMASDYFGDYGHGKIFSVDTNGNAFKLLYEFNSAGDGDNPWGSLIYAGNRLYGMTLGDLTYNYGEVFSIDTDGTGYKNLHLFNPYINQGQTPYGSLVLASGFVLYGMTSIGGANSDGVIFSVDTNGTGFKDLLDFNGTNGKGPFGTMTSIGNNLYGMARYGGTNNDGVIFGYKDTIFRVIANVSNVTCIGGHNGLSSAYISGGASPYTYMWSPGGGSYDTINNLSVGVYTISVTDSHGITATNTATITQPAAVTVSTSVLANVSCTGGNNGNANANASGGVPPYTYSWSNGSSTVSTSNPTGAILSAGSYTLTVTDFCGGPSATTSVIISGPSALVVTGYVVKNVSCRGGSDGSAEAFGSGGTSPYTYLWSPSGATTYLVNTFSAGTYSVTVTDSCHVSNTASVNITEPLTNLSVSAIAMGNVSCNGDSNGSATSSVSGGASPYTYLWSGRGGTYSAAYGLFAGTDTLIVQDSNGCSASSSVIITQPTALSVSAVTTSNVSCNGYNDGAATCTPAGGVGPYTYLWTGGETTQNSTGLFAYTYTVTVRDNNGCSATASTTITQPPVFNSGIHNYTNRGFCNFSMSDIASGGAPPYTYLWSPGGETSDSVYNQCPGTYYCYVNDAVGCLHTDISTIGCANYYNEQICITTIDTATNKSEIIWGRINSPPAGDSGFYQIYKYDGSGYVFYINRPLDSLSEYIDTGSDPSAGQASYELATYDSCGRSVLSLPNTTIFLTTTAALNVYILNWTAYVGFTPALYRIFRGPALNSMVQIDSVPNTILTFHDTLPPLGSYYAIEAVNPSGTCIPTTKIRTRNAESTSLSGSFSNGFNTKTLTGINNIGTSPVNVTIFPNPNNGIFTIVETQNIASLLWSVGVYNELGQRVYYQMGSGKINEQINLSNLSDGIYTLRLTTKTRISVQKVVVMRNR